MFRHRQRITRASVATTVFVFAAALLLPAAESTSSLPKDDARTSSDSAASGMAVVQEDEGVWFRDGAAKVMFYQLKPKSLGGKYLRANYVHPLYDLGGNVLTEDFPKDHPHHRGIFWAWHFLGEDRQNAADSWALEHWLWDAEQVRILAPRDDSAAIQVTSLWKSALRKDAQGKPRVLAREATVIRAFRAERRQRRIDFDIRLWAMQPNLRLGGSDDAKGYGGFSFRIRLPEDVQFFGRNGALTPQFGTVEGGPWLNVLGSFASAGAPGGIAVLSHPSNPGHPHRWLLRRQLSCQNAAYPGREPVPLSTVNPLILRYRMVIHDGTITTTMLEKLQREYSELLLAPQEVN